MTERPASPRTTKRKAPADRPRIGAPRKIADLMPKIGEAAFKKFGFIQASIVTRWPEIVGNHYANISTPDSIRFPVGKKSDGTLQLTVMSGHAPMLQHALPEIVERVNRFFGYAAVAKVAMKQGNIQRQIPVDRPKSASMLPIPTEMDDSIKTIDNPELRTVLESLARGVANSRPAPKIR